MSLIFRLAYEDGSTYWYYENDDNKSVPNKDYLCYDVYSLEENGVYRTVGRGEPPVKVGVFEESEVRHAVNLFTDGCVYLDSQGDEIKL